MCEMQKALLKKWEDAGLTDDYVFNKVMLDHDICLEVLQRILPELHIKKIKILNSQQEFTVAPDAKAVRFDIYTTDENGNHYDIEMQVADKHNIAKRIHYYQSVSAIESYEKGQNYAQANDSYVIFFCNFDPFGFDLQRYDLHKHIDQKPEAIIEDGTTDILFNVPSKRHDVDPKIQVFLDMIARRRVEEDDEFVVKLKKRMHKVKLNREWRAEYMRLSMFEMDQQIKKEQLEQLQKEVDQRQEQLEQQKKKVEQYQKEVEQQQKEVVQHQKKIERERKEIRSQLKEIKHGVEKAQEKGVKQGATEQLTKNIEATIAFLHQQNAKPADIIAMLKGVYGLGQEEAEKYLAKYQK